MPRPFDISKRVAQLRTFQKEEGREPSWSEMMRIFGYRSKGAVNMAVKHLIHAGYLERRSDGRISYTPRLVGGIKLLDNYIQAGFPSPAEEELADTMSLDEFLVSEPARTYLVRVRGDSLIEIGIFPDDWVLVERRNSAREGRIIIAEVDGEYTMKIFGKDKDGYYLDPANANYSRIRPESSFRVCGVVKSLIRKFD